jgi:hypothetical protein
VLQVQVLGGPSAQEDAFAPHESPLPVQVPLRQTLLVGHDSPLVHAVLSASGAFAHVPALQTPVLHPSVRPEQFIGVL